MAIGERGERVAQARRRDERAPRDTCVVESRPEPARRVRRAAPPCGDPEEIRAADTVRGNPREARGERGIVDARGRFRSARRAPPEAQERCAGEVRLRCDGRRQPVPQPVAKEGMAEERDQVAGVRRAGMNLRHESRRRHRGGGCVHLMIPPSAIGRRAERGPRRTEARANVRSRPARFGVTTVAEDGVGRRSERIERSFAPIFATESESRGLLKPWSRLTGGIYFRATWPRQRAGGGAGGAAPRS